MDFVIIAVLAAVTIGFVLAVPDLGVAMSIGCLIALVSAVSFLGLRRLGWFEGF
ncbi:MAG TPA: hypothetical protein VIG51_10060 [Candidatus Baltobacteraceae bacterium]|jgi:uncharacterized membrane protein